MVGRYPDCQGITLLPPASFRNPARRGRVSQRRRAYDFSTLHQQCRTYTATIDGSIPRQHYISSAACRAITAMKIQNAPRNGEPFKTPNIPSPPPRYETQIIQSPYQLVSVASGPQRLLAVMPVGWAVDLATPAKAPTSLTRLCPAILHGGAGKLSGRRGQSQGAQALCVLQALIAANVNDKACGLDWHGPPV